LGGRGPFLLSGTLYIVGSAANRPTLNRVALHNLEAVALSGGVAGLIRGLTGRALPNVAATRQFSFGRGFHDNNGPFVAFPSGHTTAAFAMATTISAEVGRASPGIAPIVTPAAFALATAVGFARVAQRVHWPTDLPLASALGIWSGRAVQAHSNGGGLLWSAMRGVAVAPASNGRTLVVWSSCARRTDASLR
jgi:membrane-associated phospholipid phosphatase